jgi:hypothetical protein
VHVGQARIDAGHAEGLARDEKKELRRLRRESRLLRNLEPRPQLAGGVTLAPGQANVSYGGLCPTPWLVAGSACLAIACWRSSCWRGSAVLERSAEGDRCHC